MLVSFSHKLNPALQIGIDILRNADFSNTKVFNEDESLAATAMGKGRFRGEIAQAVRHPRRFEAQRD